MLENDILILNMTTTQKTERFDSEKKKYVKIWKK